MPGAAATVGDLVLRPKLAADSLAVDHDALRIEAVVRIRGQLPANHDRSLCFRDPDRVGLDGDRRSFHRHTRGDRLRRCGCSGQQRNGGRSGDEVALHVRNSCSRCVDWIRMPMFGYSMLTMLGSSAGSLMSPSCAFSVYLYCLWGSNRKLHARTLPEGRTA